VGGTRRRLHPARRPTTRFRADWEEFKDLLTEAGIDDRRLYDGSRHTAGTILNELSVDIVTIMEILRHTRPARPADVKGPSHLSKDAMRRMGDTFMPGPPPAPKPASETTTETGDSRRPRPAPHLHPHPHPHPLKAKAPGHGE
jgi:hypothetical protein